jgi:hypothetical protein
MVQKAVTRQGSTATAAASLARIPAAMVAGTDTAAATGTAGVAAVGTGTAAGTITVAAVVAATMAAATAATPTPANLAHPAALATGSRVADAGWAVLAVSHAAGTARVTRTGAGSDGVLVTAGPADSSPRLSLGLVVPCGKSGGQKP